MRNTCLGLATMLALLSGCQQPTATADKPGTEEAQKSAPVVGSIAPMFTTQGALAGKPFTLDLAEQLKKGPLVLYFFPKVFTSGCTAEAHEFAERSGDFAKLGANVVGLSADSIEELSKFSREACRDKFAVARATPEIIKAYDVKMPAIDMTNRTSFVIAQDGRIAFIHSDLDYQDHVRLTYEAVRKLKESGTPTT
ncbi:MAG: peroxiredoxin [Sphingomonadales bacterium]|jgi:peroxiredoxin Q/BCP|nr:peroxiredoxin [Sphingomonadales bacterium]MBK9005012.1 peroxiredoxin [Sphingomonadales bacterium]MBK9267255.1 peroxiredoxin [Sphingomonadales bacterium]MBP6433583.1 peroxiredoxin [Sphingorhabdus sp.]